MTSQEDADLDRDFKPSRRRPQSMMALDFMSSLDNAFNMDNSLAELSLSIDKKHQSISLQSAELETLQEQIRKADELLEKRKSGVFTGSWASILAANTSPHKRQPLPKSVMEEMSSDDSSSEDEQPVRPTPTRARSSTTSAQAGPQGSPAAKRPATSAGTPRRKAQQVESSSESETTSDSDSDDEANTNPLTQATDSSEEEKVEPKKPLQRKPISPKTVKA